MRRRLGLWSRFKVGFARRLGRWAVKGYSDIAGTGGHMADWILSGIREDQDLMQNIGKLRQRSQDLWKTNPFMRKFRRDLIANTFGSEGITLQMKIKEETDRVVYADDSKAGPRELAEKAWLEARQRAHDDLRERAQKHGMALRQRQFVSVSTAGNNGSTRAKATIRAGHPDVYANNLIERAWKRWQRKQNCTVSRKVTYAATRHQRVTMCARDGDVFIRLVRGFDNEFGFAIQLVASEFVDHQLNEVLENGNEIKMGIEYNSFGEAVAYHVIKRHARDWMHGAIYAHNRNDYERVAAREMIHYCEFEDGDSGRGAPWIASVIPRLRHLDVYEENEVVASRAETCKGGHYKATVPGLDPIELADRIERGSGQLTDEVEPGMWKALPFGWEPEAHDPTHPNGNFPSFKKEVGRTIAIGCGGFYNTMFGDLEGVNFTSSRAGFMDVRELYKLTQQFDIDTAEIPIFEAWLEMALMKKAIPLPLTKIEKFNQPHFQGRRWESIQPIDDIRAKRLAIEGCLDSRSRICAEDGRDFEDVIEELVTEKVLMEEAGIVDGPVAVTNGPQDAKPPGDGNEEQGEEKPAKPKRTKKRLASRSQI